MKRSRKICLVVLSLFLAVWLFTGGFVRINFKWFSASGNIFKKSDLRIILDTDFDYDIDGMPFFFLYEVEKEPYKIHLLVQDESKAISGIELDYLKISYVNGKTLEFELNRYYEVPVEMWPNPDDDYKETLARKRLFLYFEDENGKIELFDHIDMAVELSGTAIIEDGTKDEFLIDAHFKAKTTEGIITFWMYANQ